MAMLTKTIGDVINMTEVYLYALSCSLGRGAQQNQDDRAKFLLTYLSEKELDLYRLTKDIGENADGNELKTWFYEYSDRHSVIHSDPHALSFSTMSPDEVQSRIAEIHNELIDLYQHMKERAENNNIKQVLESVLKTFNSSVNQISASAETVREL